LVIRFEQERVFRVSVCLSAIAVAMLSACGGATGESADSIFQAPTGHSEDQIGPSGRRSTWVGTRRGEGGSLGVVAVAQAAATLPIDPVVAAAPGAPTTVPVVTTRSGINVDTTNLPVPKPGVNAVMLTAPGDIPPRHTDSFEDGAFRLLCNWAKMSFDDPIVYPGQPGLAHHHTFFGNTAIDAYTTPENIRSKGNASCRGGTVNLSGYWVPSMIDTTTGKPLAPADLIVYYKTGYWTWLGDHDTNLIRPFPKGLRMITGNSAGSEPNSDVYFECRPVGQERRPGFGSSIPACMPGDQLRIVINFRQCWDGVNLDSPDHKSHMADVVGWGQSPDPQRQMRCPTTHPVVLPRVSFTVEYPVPAGADTTKWRLSSDTYDRALPGGYSFHADWMNGWDPAISDLWGNKCMQERRECGSYNLGDGRVSIEFQGN
jgi:hypothetical protein